MKHILSLISLCLVLGFGTAFLIPTKAQQPNSEVTQLLPFRMLQPKENFYVNVGTVGTNELMPCVAATRVWNTDINKRTNVLVYCRIQANGYAAVSFYNNSEHPVGVYDKVRVIFWP